MKKVLTLSIAALALLAFAVAPVMAGENCASKASKTDSKSCSASKTDAIKASAKDKAACSSSKTDAIKASAKDKAACSSSKTDAIKASANGAACSATAACSKEEMAACAEKLGVSVDELNKMCGPDGKMQMHTISIKGMTCGGCEADVTKAIENVGGVHKVVSISHKDANAVVCVDKGNTCLTTLTKTIADKGYQAEIIPAVAKETSVTAKNAAKGSCAATCSPKEQAACDAKKKDEKKADGTR